MGVATGLITLYITTWATFVFVIDNQQAPWWPSRPFGLSVLAGLTVGVISGGASAAVSRMKVSPLLVALATIAYLIVGGLAGMGHDHWTRFAATLLAMAVGLAIGGVVVARYLPRFGYGENRAHSADETHRP